MELKLIGTWREIVSQMADILHNAPEPTQKDAPPEPTQNYAPPEPTQNYAPPEPTQNYAPPEPTQNYAPPGQTQNYAPPGPTQNYAPPEPTQNYAPPEQTQNYAPPGQTQKSQTPEYLSSSEVPLDDYGQPWDERIHVKSKSKIKNGTWRVKPGIGKDFVKAIQAENAADSIIQKPGEPPHDLESFNIYATKVFKEGVEYTAMGAFLANQGITNIVQIPPEKFPEVANLIRDEYKVDF